MYDANKLIIALTWFIGVKMIFSCDTPALNEGACHNGRSEIVTPSLDVGHASARAAVL